ncbi:MAG: hypothetical protein JXA54_13605 [Candidatus Heimdallarchaeota archaeon]|nr:hypothetical protein [Candidatus Heimdallarchaeota archaeon]
MNNEEFAQDETPKPPRTAIWNLRHAANSPAHTCLRRRASSKSILGSSDLSPRKCFLFCG